MSDNHDYLQTSSTARLYGDVAMLMLKGAGYAMVFCLIIWFGRVSRNGRSYAVFASAD